jgi:hypothetical protein
MVEALHQLAKGIDKGLISKFTGLLLDEGNSLKFNKLCTVSTGWYIFS